MFEFVRKHTRVLQFVLLILILPSFVVFGIQGYSKFMDDASVVGHVGSQKISQSELDAAVRRRAEQVRAQNPAIDAAVFDTPDFKQAALDGLLRDYTLMAAAREQRLATPDSRLVRVFATAPDFAAYRKPDGTINSQLLESQGISSAQFAERLRQQLSVSQVLGSVENTAMVVRKSSRLAVDALFQVRDVQWTLLDPKAYTAGLNPTAEQLQKLFDEPSVSSAFLRPERADVQYVMLDLDTLKKQVSVSPDDLKKYFEQNQARFTQPEERRASHILVKSEKGASEADRKAARAKADRLLAEVQRAPASFAEVARRNSDDPGSATNGGDLDFFGRGGMVKPFEDAAFALKKGQISGVVESDFGFHIIVLTDIRGGQVSSFEAVRGQIEEEVRKQLAQRQYAEAAERFTNLVYEQSDSLQPVADELKLPLRTSEGVLRTPAAKEASPLNNAKLLAALFDASNRDKARNTEAVEVAPNVLVSARVLKHFPQARPAFTEVQAQVRERWVAREALRLAREDAERKKAEWQKTPDAAKLPASVSMSRRLAFNQPAPVLEAALRIPQDQLPAFATVDLGDKGVALLRVNKVLPLQIAPDEEKATQQQFAGYWSRAESDAYMRSLKKELKAESSVKTTPTAATAAKP